MFNRFEKRRGERTGYFLFFGSFPWIENLDTQLSKILDVSRHEDQPTRYRRCGDERIYRRGGPPERFGFHADSRPDTYDVRIDRHEPRPMGREKPFDPDSQLIAARAGIHPFDTPEKLAQYERREEYIRFGHGCRPFHAARVEQWLGEFGKNAGIEKEHFKDSRFVAEKHPSLLRARNPREAKIAENRPMSTTVPGSTAILRPRRRRRPLAHFV